MLFLLGEFQHKHKQDKFLALINLSLVRANSIIPNLPT